MDSLDKHIESAVVVTICRVEAGRLGIGIVYLHLVFG